MDQIGDLGPASGHEFKPVFNGPGTVSMSLPLSCKAAYKIRQRATGILVYRNNRDVWSGGITAISRSAKAGMASITATGWEEELDHRFVRKSEEAGLIYGSPGTVGGSIGMNLIDVVNAQEDEEGNVRPLHISSGSVSDTQVRIASYKQGDSYGSLFKGLQTIEDGFDYSLDYLTRKINTRSPDDFRVLNGLQFGWGTDPNNLDDVVENEGEITNRISVVAANGNVYPADDPIAIDAATVMLEEWTSLSDQVSPTIALAYANGELVYKRYGLNTYTLTPKQFGNMPRPYDDFEWGDQGTLAVDKDSFQIAGLGVRVFAGTITLDPQGNEIISEYQVALA